MWSPDTATRGSGELPTAQRMSEGLEAGVVMGAEDQLSAKDPERAEPRTADQSSTKAANTSRLTPIAASVARLFSRV